MAAAIPAAISGVTGIAGSAISGKGAKKAAKAIERTAQANRDFATQQYDKSAGLWQPDITQGGQASSLISGLLGLGGDQAASDAAYKTFRDSSGYNNILNEGLNAINTNAYAAGTGDSGATLKRLQTRGGEIADASLNNYVSQLLGQQQLGTTAKTNLTNLNTGLTSTIIGQNDTAGGAQANKAIFTANNLGGTIRDLGTLGAATASKYLKK